MYILFTISFITLLVAGTLYVTRARWQPLLPERLPDLPGPLPNLPARLPDLPSWMPSLSFPTSLPSFLPGRNYIYSQLPTTFAGDVEAGLSSDTFDLAGNLEGGDSRAGLDGEAKAEILRIMKKRRLRFDDARKIYLENKFKANGIGADGRPRDPKFVSFS